MRQDIRVLDRVRGAYASLRPSEQRVADYVLKDPETCTRCTISELADQVQVSLPSGRSRPPGPRRRCGPG